MIDKKLLEILVCPIGKKPVTLQDGYLVCSCGVKYPVVDDIPVMLIDEAIMPEGVTEIEQLPCMKKKAEE